MAENPKKQEDIGNIFDDFKIDDSLKKEVERREEDSKKDIFFYISKVNVFFSTVNILAILAVITLFWYIFIQKSEQPWMYAFLEPICIVFLWRNDIYDSWCSSVTYTVSQFNTLIEREENEQIDLIAPLIPDIYSLEDFFSSRRVDFALNSGISRLRPLEIVEHFDELQAQFSPIDKLEVSCQQISISSEFMVEFTCASYSSDWDTSLYRLEDGILRQSANTGWTSISKAANFIDFIENAPESRFRIVDRPNTFSSENAQFWQYTKITNFRFTVEYLSEALIY